MPQVVPQTQSVLVLSTVGVLVTFGMQFALAWFLWSSLPFNQGDDRPPLDRVWPPNRDGAPKFSICRTHPFAQVLPAPTPA